MLPSLEQLDGIDITRTERMSARNVMSALLAELRTLAEAQHMLKDSACTAINGKVRSCTNGHGIILRLASH